VATYPRVKQAGFTLIEVMLVIVVIGMMVAAVQLNFANNKPEKKLEQEALRFAGVFNLAAEYGLLNNIELGLVIKDGSYEFVGYDGVSWTSIPDNEMLASYKMPEELNIALNFDDLEPDTEALVSRELFEPEEESLFDEEEEEKVIPQVYILSGGDITPFKAAFTFTDEFLLEQVVSDFQSQMILNEGAWDTVKKFTLSGAKNLTGKVKDAFAKINKMYEDVTLKIWNVITLGQAKLEPVKTAVNKILSKVGELQKSNPTMFKVMIYVSMIIVISAVIMINTKEAAAEVTGVKTLQGKVAMGLLKEYFKKSRNWLLLHFQLDLLLWYIFLKKLSKTTFF